MQTKSEHDIQVLIVHPAPDVYEQLAKPALAEPDVELIQGEVGAIDCGIHFIERKP